MRITILTLGSRGDVEPYVALGVALREAGHEVSLGTGPTFERMVSEQGLRYGRIDVDYEGMMETPEARALLTGAPWRAMRFMRETVWPMLRRGLDDGWAAARDAEAVVYHPKALAGYHVAEKLDVPGILAAVVPAFAPTAALPHPLLPFGVPGPLNRASYSLLERLSILPYRGLINRWRKRTLGLAPRRPFATELERDGRPVPVLFGFSRHVVPPPPDWPEHVRVTGYWFLNRGNDWRPAAELERFLEAGPAPVYVGFGSMAGRNPAQVTRTVLEALGRAGQRGVLATGWGGLSAVGLPPTVHLLSSAPHDWLFPRMAAVVHHGGAGTTHAGLRAGKPTVVCPFFGDQSFWGARVHALGVGTRPIPQRRLSPDRLGEAIRVAATDGEMRRRAAALGEAIQSEDGAGTAAAAVDTLVRAWGR